MLLKQKERPILFSGAMVNAIFEGRKTQTRRVISIPPFDPTDESLGIHAMVNKDKCPYGQPGDLLWVRETWAEDLNGYIYRADGCWDDNKSIKWKPSIFMPRAACRLELRVKDVRVERLQDIDEHDAEQEGVEVHPRYEDERKYVSYAKPFDLNFFCWGAKESFATLWDSINAKRGYSWDSNPWLWVIEFERV